MGVATWEEKKKNPLRGFYDGSEIWDGLIYAHFDMTSNTGSQSERRPFAHHSGLRRERERVMADMLMRQSARDREGRSHMEHAAKKIDMPYTY